MKLVLMIPVRFYPVFVPHPLVDVTAIPRELSQHDRPDLIAEAYSSEGPNNNVFLIDI